MIFYSQLGVYKDTKIQRLRYSPQDVLPYFFVNVSYENVVVHQESRCNALFFKGSGMRYSLRDSENKLLVPLPRINYLQNSFSYSGVALWNSLP